MADIKDYLRLALKDAEVEVQPLVGIMREPLSGLVITDYARQNEKRPASMTFYVPDDWVKNFKGNDKLKDSYVVTRIPREFAEKYREENEIKDKIEQGTSVYAEVDQVSSGIKE